MVKIIAGFFAAIRHYAQQKTAWRDFFLAAEKLKVKPDECIVIENAPYGIESAKRAGMRCIAVSTSLSKEFLKEADFVVARLSEIAKFISL